MQTKERVTKSQMTMAKNVVYLLKIPWYNMHEIKWHSVSHLSRTRWIVVILCSMYFGPINSISSPRPKMSKFINNDYTALYGETLNSDVSNDSQAFQSLYHFVNLVFCLHQIRFNSSNVKVSKSNFRVRSVKSHILTGVNQLTDACLFTLLDAEDAELL